MCSRSSSWQEAELEISVHVFAFQSLRFSIKIIKTIPFLFSSALQKSRLKGAKIWVTLLCFNNFNTHKFLKISFCLHHCSETLVYHSYSNKSLYFLNKWKKNPTLVTIIPVLGLNENINTYKSFGHSWKHRWCSINGS